MNGKRVKLLIRTSVFAGRVQRIHELRARTDFENRGDASRSRDLG